VAADPRFFTRKGPFALGFLAERIGATLALPEFQAVVVADIATLDTARPGEISVYSDARYRDAAAVSQATAIITSPAFAPELPGGAIILLLADPRLGYARVGSLFYPSEDVEAGIDPGARVDPSATVGADTRIEVGAVIGPFAQIGARCRISANVVIGRGVVIGDDCAVGANSVISHALIGDRVDIASCVSIGVQGFGFVPGPRGLERMQQLGRVIIGDGVEIGANSAIDRGATDDTVIGAGTVIDNLVQIGHNVRIGRHCVLSGQAGIAGSSTIGDGVMIGGGASISDHLVIGAAARIAGKSGVARDVEAGKAFGGYPAVPIRQWHRQSAALARLGQRNGGGS
jgi:UDP-3-O-[3-hydroxymyristoyl] glucosamine N-acyltransferase